EFAVLNIASYVHARFHVMAAASDGDDVRVGVNVLPERLRVAIVGAEAHAAIVETDGRNSGNVRRLTSWRGVARVTRPEFIQHPRAEGVYEAELAVGVSILGRVAESAAAGRDSGACRVGLDPLIEFQEETVLVAVVPVQTSLEFIRLEQVSACWNRAGYLNQRDRRKGKRQCAGAWVKWRAWPDERCKLIARNSIGLSSRDPIIAKLSEPI